MFRLSCSGWWRGYARAGNVLFNVLGNVDIVHMLHVHRSRNKLRRFAKSYELRWTRCHCRNVTYGFNLNIGNVLRSSNAFGDLTHDSGNKIADMCNLADVKICFPFAVNSNWYICVIMWNDSPLFINIFDDPIREYYRGRHLKPRNHHILLNDESC